MWPFPTGIPPENVSSRLDRIQLWFRIFLTSAGVVSQIVYWNTYPENLLTHETFSGLAR
jgi:hypothetical protein